MLFFGLGGARFQSRRGFVCGRKQEVHVKIEGVVGESVLALVQDFFHQRYRN